MVICLVTAATPAGKLPVGDAATRQTTAGNASAPGGRVLSRLYYIKNGNENENITENITGR